MFTRLPLKQWSMFLVMTGLVVATLGPFLLVNAQATEPTAIIDAALKDLSQKLGRTLSRGTVDNWTWEQIDFPDASLGCPQPGKTYAQVVTRGYRLTFTTRGVTYEYRALNDGSVLFQCTASGAAPAATSPVVVPPTAAPVVPTAAGQPILFQKPLAYVGADGNVTIATIGQDLGVPITGDAARQSLQAMPFYQVAHAYGQFRWSPDGTKLLFTDVSARNLYLAISGQKPVMIARGLAAGYPGTWSPDGNEVAYAVETNQPQGDGLVRQVQAIPVTATGAGQPRVAGSFVQGSGCGNIELDPAEAAYRAEAGFEGNGLTLAWTAQGFVYSTLCQGVGLALANSGGQVLWTVADVARAAVSPDRSRAVAARYDSGQRATTGLVLIDLTNGSVTPLQSEASPDQVAWSADGANILYSTVNPLPSVMGNPGTVGQQLFQAWPLEGKSYNVTLWRMPAAGGPSTRLFQQEGRGIGVISAATDTSGVVFSVISSMAHMFQAINSGISGTQAAAAAPRAQVYLASWNGDIPARLLFSGNSYGGQPACDAATFTAVPAAPITGSAQAPGGSVGSVGNVGNASVPPPNLVIGGQAVVTTTRGDTLNLRQTPGLSAPVLRILKPGAVVTILAGPQMVDNFRWWQVSADDGSVGWVVDQVTDQDGTTNTLAPQ
jgi:Tol biopolymer transport system component